MENPFKKILQDQELPEVLKNKVLNDIGMIKLTLDVADLFVVKYPTTIADLLSGGKPNNKNKKNNL